MAVRVRKMARELDRSPEDLLRLLKDLGYARFRSEDDMMPDPVAEQLRKAARTTPARAILPVGPRRPLPSARPLPGEPQDSLGGDLMSQLVPGVVRAGEEPKPRKPASAPPPKPEPAKPEPEPPRLDPLKVELEALQAKLAAETQALQLRQAELEQRALELEQRAKDLEEKTPKLALSRGAMLGNSVLALMEERGLRGQDEAERAIAALAGAHALGRLLGTLVPGDPVAFTKLLQERLVLVGGPVPEGFGVPAVTVSDERADLPGGERLGRTVGKIGELLLLNGHRRVLIVGFPPRWHNLLRESMDRRVELSFRPSAPAAASEELGRVDAVVAWNTEIEGPSPRGKTLSIVAPTVGEFLERWCLALTQATVDGP